MSNKKQIIISVESNPLKAKVFEELAMCRHSHPGMIVHDCTTEILDGLKLNVLDLPFYVAALESLLESLMTMLDDRDKELLNKIRNATNTATIHMNEEFFNELKNLRGDTNEK